MSWLFSQALVAAYSAGTCSAGGQSAQSNTTPTPQAFLWRDKTTDAWNRFPSGMTCELLTADRGEALLMWCLEGSRAKTLALPTIPPQDSKANEAGCGPKCGVSFATFDPDLRLWRTAQLLLFGGSEPFSETWPRWGLMQGGACFRLPMLEHNTSENASGSWPTPTKWEEKYIHSRSPGDHYHGIGWILWNQRNLQPTPQCYEALMGWPIGWTALHDAETVKFRQWCASHGIPSPKGLT
jgi:hypothetical protein